MRPSLIPRLKERRSEAACSKAKKADKGAIRAGIHERGANTNCHSTICG